MTEYLLTLIALAAAAVFCIYRVAKAFKFVRMVMDTPTSKVRSAAQGYVELKGVAKPLDHPVQAALTSKPCVWYEYVIEKEVVHYDSKGRRTTSWEVVDSHLSSHLFYLEDDTGRVIVYPLSANVSAKIKETWYGSSLGSNSSFAGHSLLSDLIGTFSGSRLRFTETRIEPDQNLVALGFFHTCKLNESPFDLDHVKKNRQALLDEKKSKLMKIKSLAHVAEALTSNTADAIAKTEDEWRKAQSQQKQKFCNVLHKKERPFILSSLSEKNLIRSYYWSSFFYSLGFIGSVVALYYAYTHGGLGI